MTGGHCKQTQWAHHIAFVHFCACSCATMWRRNHGVRESQARQELNYDGGSLHHESKAMTDSKRRIASIRQVRVALLPFGVLILLLIRAECRRTPTIALTTNDPLQEERQAGRLRFDWTNMTLHSNMAKRIYAHSKTIVLFLFRVVVHCYHMD